MGGGGGGGLGNAEVQSTRGGGWSDYWRMRSMASHQAPPTVLLAGWPAPQFFDWENSRAMRRVSEYSLDWTERTGLELAWDWTGAGLGLDWSWTGLKIILVHSLMVYMHSKQLGNHQVAILRA